MNATTRTCPACLGSFRLHADGSLVRHGFQAFDVRHGAHEGWHTSACSGTKAPFFEGPQGLAWAKDFNKTLAWEKSDAEAKLAEATTELADTEAVWPEPRDREAQEMVGRRRRIYQEAKVRLDTVRRWYTEHCSAIENWSEGVAPQTKVWDVAIHLLDSDCPDRRHPQDKQTNNEAEVNCPACLSVLAKTAEARRQLPALDAALQTLAGMVETAGKLYDAVNSATKKPRSKFAKALTAAQVEALRSDEPTPEGRLVRRHWCRAVDVRAAATPLVTYEAVDSEGTRLQKRSRTPVAAALVIGCTKARKAEIRAKPYDERTEAEHYEYHSFRSARFFATMEEAQAALRRTKGFSPEVVPVVQG